MAGITKGQGNLFINNKFGWQEFKKIRYTCAWCSKNFFPPYHGNLNEIVEKWDKFVYEPAELLIIIQFSKKQDRKVIKRRKFEREKLGGMEAVQLRLKGRSLVGLCYSINRELVCLHACSESCAKTMLEAINSEFDVVDVDISIG